MTDLEKLLKLLEDRQKELSKRFGKTGSDIDKGRLFENQNIIVKIRLSLEK